MMMLKTTLLSIRTPRASPSALTQSLATVRVRVTHQTLPCIAAAVVLVNAGGHTSGHGHGGAPDGWPACYRGPEC